MDRKIQVAYIGGLPYPPNFNMKWGGDHATNYCYQKAFDGDPEYELTCLHRPQTVNAENIKRFLDNKAFDIVHVDDIIPLKSMVEAGMASPDVIGPIANSPVKKYGLPGGGIWQCPYSEEWFYSAKVIRLNHFEEQSCPERVTIITHGVDTDLLKPGPVGNRRVILWAGDSKRGAKNFKVWEDIQLLEPPNGYEYRTMSGHTVADYWAALDDVAILINTSSNETFCSAAFEAMAWGVPVIWRKALQGGVHEGAGIRVAYQAEAYREAMDRVLASWATNSHEARQYVENNCTLKHMRDSYAKVYAEVINQRKQ